MKERGIVPRNVTYTILIDAFARENDMERAFEMYQSMERAWLKIDVYTYGVLICCLCSDGNMKDALKLFKLMVEEKGLKPSDQIYDMMICGYCRQGSSYSALRLLKKMRENGMVPNVTSYGLTIRVCCIDGKLEDTEPLLHEMVSSGLQPSD